MDPLSDYLLAKPLAILSIDSWLCSSVHLGSEYQTETIWKLIKLQDGIQNGCSVYLPFQTPTILSSFQMFFTSISTKLTI